MAGRISLKIDSPLRDMFIVARNVPDEARKYAQRYSRQEADPILREELAGRASSRMQRVVLVDSARVGVTGQNIMLRSGGVGRTSKGTPVSDLRVAAEFGMQQDRTIRQRSRTGTWYDRQVGRAFGPRNRRGKVFYPATAASTARIASVVIQSYARALLDALDLKK